MLVSSMVVFAYYCKQRSKNSKKLVEIILKELRDQSLPFNIRLFNAREKSRSVKGVSAQVTWAIFNELRYIYEQHEDLKRAQNKEENKK